MVLLGESMSGRSIDQHAHGSGHLRVLPLSAIPLTAVRDQREAVYALP